MKQLNKTGQLVQGALIAALYAAATYLSSAFGIAFGPVQFRFSEAITALALLTPAAIPGLTVGCMISNLASPMGIWDIIFGSAATLLAAITARKLRNIKIRKLPLLSIIMPAVFNALMIGAELTFVMPQNGGRLAVFAVNAFQVGLGELAVCLAGGIPVYFGLKKTKLFVL